LKITAKNQFYNAESDEFTTNTTGSDGLIRNKQERLFTTKSDKAALSAGVYLSINLLKPAEHCL
jgi:hypothetical protein